MAEPLCPWVALQKTFFLLRRGRVQFVWTPCSWDKELISFKLLFTKLFFPKIATAGERRAV